MSPQSPSDRELLRSVYRRLDRDGLLADHPGLTPEDIRKLFRRLAALLPETGSGCRIKQHQPRNLQSLPAPRASRQAGAIRDKIVLHTDGGSRGNPGPAGYGVVLTDGSGKVLEERGEFIGRATNNEAEYRGLIAGLERARALGASEVIVRADSELVVRQINGRYRVKSARLRPLYAQSCALLEGFERWRVDHVPRERNARADALANEAMNRAGKISTSG